MNVIFGSGQGSVTDVHRVNQSFIARNGNKCSEQTPKTERGDSVTISPQGRKKSLLENLMKQKENIVEQKNSLVSATLENGNSLDSIQVQLENYDEQMKNVDKQITEIMAEEMEKQVEKLKTKKQEDSTPKTEEEIQNERLANITSLSSDLEQNEVVRSVQIRVDGEARVLKSEIELDKAKAGTSTKSIEKKEATLADMQEKSLDLTSQMFDKIADVVKKTKDINQPQEVMPSKESKEDEISLTNEQVLQEDTRTH